MIVSVLAGNIVHITRTFTRPVGSTTSVNPSTIKIAVTNPDGTNTALTPSAPSYNGDNSAFTFTADWTIADAAAEGYYTITVDTSGGLVAAHQETVGVQARKLAVVP